jgi:hypothetical protein
MDWRLKALAFRLFDFPGGTHAHYFLQRHVTRTWPRPAENLNSLAGIARRVVTFYERYIAGVPRSALEIGAGRDLAVPLALRAIGDEPNDLFAIRGRIIAVPWGLKPVEKPDRMPPLVLIVILAIAIIGYFWSHALM